MGFILARLLLQEKYFLDFGDLLYFFPALGKAMMGVEDLKLFWEGAFSGKVFKKSGIESWSWERFFDFSIWVG